MGVRVLGAGNWYRPGWVGAGCDARVLGLHHGGELGTKVGYFGVKSAKVLLEQMGT